MNQKSAQTTSPPKIHSVDDIIYSDADTLPEISNRDGSKESVDKSWQLMMVRVAEQLPDAQIKTVSESVAAELRTIWKVPPASLSFSSAPHLPILHVAHATAKKTLGERAQVRSYPHFAEPKNEKLLIAKESEMKGLKLEVIMGTSKFNWDKPESHQDVAKRMESTLSEVTRAFPNIVLFLGPTAFDALYESLEKQKRKSNSPMKPTLVVVEHFRRKNNNSWKRLPKTAAPSLTSAASLKPI